jgi:hypothetical protein
VEVVWVVEMRKKAVQVSCHGGLESLNIRSGSARSLRVQQLKVTIGVARRNAKRVSSLRSGVSCRRQQENSRSR